MQSRRLGNQYDAGGESALRYGLALGLRAQASDKGLHIGRAAVVHNLVTCWVRHHAGIFQSSEHRDQVVLGELQREEVLANQNVVVLNTPKGVPVGFPRKELASGSGPRR